MDEILTPRLYALRACYLLLVIGLGLEIWPGMIHHDKPWELMQGVVHCMLAALSALAILGLRYPVAMLPLLLFELTWKAFWLVVVALPLWSSHRMDQDTLETAYECLMAVIFLPIIPWSHVFGGFVARPSERWR